MENEEPCGNDAAEQKARSEHDKKEAQHLPEPHRLDRSLTPRLFLGILNVYVLFVATLVAVGGLAFYGNHFTTLKIILIASGVLLLVLPVSAVWYLLAVLRTPAKIRETVKHPSRFRWFTESATGRGLLRLSNSRVYQIVVILLCLTTTAVAITYIFPKHPRFSLAVISFYTACFVLFVMGLLLKYSFELIERDIRKIWDFNEKVQRAVVALGDGTARVIDLQATSSEAHLETHKHLVAVVEAVQRTTEVWANPAQSTQAEPPPDEDQGSHDR